MVQVAINPKVPRICHRMNRLNHWSSLVSNREASLAMGPSSQPTGDLLVTTDYVEIEESKRVHFLRKQELRQVYDFAICTSYRT